MQKTASMSGVRAPFTVRGSPNLAPKRSLTAHRRIAVTPVRAVATTTGTELIAEAGIASLQGTSRKQNEDRFSLDVSDLEISILQLNYSPRKLDHLLFRALSNYIVSFCYLH